MPGGFLLSLSLQDVPRRSATSGRFYIALFLAAPQLSDEAKQDTPLKRGKRQLE